MLACAGTHALPDPRGKRANVKAIRWLPAAIAAAALVGLLMAVVLPAEAPISGAPERSALPTPAASTPGSGTPVPSPAPIGEVQGLNSYVGPRYDINFVTEPTDTSVQSKLWFHDGSWWGILSSEQTGQFQVHELDWDTQRWVDRGVLVDERPFVQLDAISDGTGIYVAASGTRASPGHALRVRRFSYDESARTYRLDQDFPRDLTDGGVTDVSMAISADGRVWLAYIAVLRVTMTYSDTGGVSWVDPFIMPADEAQLPAERAAITASDGQIAVAWTSQQDDLLHAAIHVNGAPDDDWTVHSVEVAGLTYGEDQLSARATSDGELLIAVRSSLDRVDNDNPDSPQILLSRLDGDTWTQAVVSRVRDGHASPQVLVDETRERVYIFAEAEGSIYVKQADLEALSFSPGLGSVAIIPSESEDAGTPSANPSPAASGTPGAEAEVPSMTRVSSTKQTAAGLGEIVVIASDDVNGRYGHGVVSLEGGRLPPPEGGHLGEPPPHLIGGLPLGTTTALFRDSFLPFLPGPATPTGWATRDEPADQVLQVAEPSSGDPSLRLTPNDLGDGPRACKQFAASSSGVLVVRATVQVRGIPDSDATISTFRSAAGEVASVRFGEPGTFRYFVGNERITTGIAYQPGAWYSSVLVLDFASQTYDWSITPHTATEPILVIENVALRTTADSVDEVCVQSSNQLPGGGVEMYVDDVSVERGPAGA